MPSVASATDGAAPKRPAKVLGRRTSPSMAKADTTAPPTMKRRTYSVISLSSRASTAGRRAAALMELDGASIDDQRPSRMIGDETVVLEADGVGFSRLGKLRSLPLAGAPETGGALRVFFQILNDRHDRPPSEL